MPKIIENLREQLLAETKRQAFELGYSQTTIRSVASACGVGIGTVYNYFKSKDMLVAEVVHDDWKRYLKLMSELSYEDPKVFFAGIYSSLMQFAADYEKLFSDPDAARLASNGSESRHKMLREQIVAFVLPFCQARKFDDPRFASEFISESILCWSMQKEDFAKVYPLLEKIIK